MRILLLTALLALAAWLTVPAVAAADEMAAGEAINAPGGYEFAVEGLGKMQMTGVEVDGKASADCLVSVTSVQQQIADGVRERTLAYSPAAGVAGAINVIVDLRKTSCQGGRVCCSDQGKGCKVLVTIEGVTATKVLAALGG